MTQAFEWLQYSFSVTCSCLKKANPYGSHLKQNFKKCCQPWENNHALRSHTKQNCFQSNVESALCPSDPCVSVWAVKKLLREIAQSDQEITFASCLSLSSLSVDLSSRSLLKQRSVPAPRPPQNCSENTKPNVLALCCLKLPTVPFFSLKNCVDFQILTTGPQRSQTH